MNNFSQRRGENPQEVINELIYELHEARVILYRWATSALSSDKALKELCEKLGVVIPIGKVDEKI